MSNAIIFYLLFFLPIAAMSQLFSISAKELYPHGSYPGIKARILDYFFMCTLLLAILIPFFYTKWWQAILLLFSYILFGLFSTFLILRASGALKSKSYLSFIVFHKFVYNNIIYVVVIHHVAYFLVKKIILTD